MVFFRFVIRIANLVRIWQFHYGRRRVFLRFFLAGGGFLKVFFWPTEGFLRVFVEGLFRVLGFWALPKKPEKNPVSFFSSFVWLFF